jgi:hypothetical protein
MRHSCQLVCAGFGRADVHAAVNQGRIHADDLDGLLLRTTLQQRYRNRSGRLLETVYTFPLAHGVSLLGLSVTLGDKKMSGAVIEKREAMQRFIEEANN